MSSNYEWNKQWVQQRLRARYDDAALYRRARQSSSVTQRQHRHRLSPLSRLAALWHRLRPRRTPSTTSAIAAQNDLV